MLEQFKEDSMTIIYLKLKTTPTLLLTINLLTHLDRELDSKYKQDSLNSNNKLLT